MEQQTSFFKFDYLEKKFLLLIKYKIRNKRLV